MDTVISYGIAVMEIATVSLLVLGLIAYVVGVIYKSLRKKKI